MAYYLIQVSYSSSAVKALTEHPHDRFETIQKFVASAGGKLHQMFFSFGEFDVVLVAELPSNQVAAAMALATGSAGSVSRYQTTVLFTTQEAAESMKLARTLAYTPPR